jgi:hypothetical protein
MSIAVLAYSSTIGHTHPRECVCATCTRARQESEASYRAMAEAAWARRFQREIAEARAAGKVCPVWRNTYKSECVDCTEWGGDHGVLVDWSPNGDVCPFDEDRSARNCHYCVGGAH